MLWESQFLTHLPLELGKELGIFQIRDRGANSSLLKRPAEEKNS